MSAPAGHLGLDLERIARAAPDRTAVADLEATLTYGELLSSAGALAASLGPLRGAARPVALLMPHRARAVECIVAAVLVGRPYVVLNPAQPLRRIEALLAAAEPDVVWATDAELRDRLESVGMSSAEPGSGRVSGGARSEGSEPVDGLCALYATSGSSGSPRLVGYRQTALRRRAGLYATAIGAGPDDRFSLVSPLWTAAAASGLFTALSTGAALQLLEPGALTPASLADRIASGGITVWHSTPSLFRRLAGAGPFGRNRFRVLRLGGEPVLATDVELARRTCDGDTLLVTGYSLTEANGMVTQSVVPLGAAGADAVRSAGRPVPGVELRVERRDGGPAATGEEGEIVVGGELISAGYFGSAERRAGTRFTRRGAARVLITGDRGILLADGSLQVLGRDDGRLKVRGHRVDPSEVEAAAMRLAGVLDAALVPCAEAANGRPTTALFVAADRGGGVTRRTVRAHLERAVPSEAVPAVVKVRDRLPLTESGKVDRLRLARLIADGAPDQRARRERSDPVLGHMQRLLREALGVEGVGPSEDFLALGGDSLAAAEICAGVESTYGVAMEPAALLRHPSARKLARHVSDALRGSERVSRKVFELNPGGAEAPLFVVPGAGSDATALVHFAEAIGAHQPVNVIQLPGADGRSRPLTRMDRITAHCLAAIQETGARPPYRIAGTSFGGQVAYDVAAELGRRGVELEYVGLFDTRAPSRGRRHLTEPLRRFRMPPGLSVRLVLRSGGAELRRLKRPVQKLLDNYRLTISLLLGLRWRPPVGLRYRGLRAGCSIAAGRWTPDPSATPIHLYRCESQPADLAGEAFLGWDRHAFSIVLRRLPAGHGRHIRPPEVSRLAAMVDEDLRRTRDALRAPAPAAPALESAAARGDVRVVKGDGL